MQMDDTIGQNESTYMVRNVLLDRRIWVLGILLFGLSLSSFCQNYSPTYSNCDSNQSKTVQCIEYHPNKQKAFVAKYKNGLRHGVWQYYHSDGDVDRRIKYKKGKRRWTYIYKDEKIAVTIDRKGKVRKKRECDCY
jgi:hypothetical protein